MICPKCGKEIPEDKVFCLSCGYAVQIVPDYEVDLEESIAETRSDMADVLDSLFFKDGSRRVSEGTAEMPWLKEKLRFIRTASLLLWIMLIAIVLALFFLGSMIYRRTTEKVNHIAEAEKLYAEGKYEEAAAFYDEVFKKSEEEDKELLFSEQLNYADSLKHIGRNEDAEDILRNIISEDPQNDGAYQSLILLYKDEGRNEEINRLLGSCRDEEIYGRYADYMTMPPLFSAAGGKYVDRVRLELMSENDGAIYYTLDGSIPNEDSELYTGPILIDAGETTVTAIFENPYNMASIPVHRIYEVEFEAPEAPEITPASGRYGEPKYISATVPEDCLVYYTEDGSTPTEESLPYSAGELIAMPLGKSTLSFVAISGRGVSSNVVSEEYSLSIPAICSPEDAVNYVTASLTATGFLNNVNGAKSGVDGHYRYKSTRAAKEGSRTYYIVEEFLEDSTGAASLTGSYYAVDVISCMMYRAKRGPDGRFMYTLFY